MGELPKEWNVYLCTIHGWTASYSCPGDAISFAAYDSPMGNVLLGVSSAFGYAFSYGDDEALNKTLGGALSDVAERATSAAKSALVSIADPKRANEDADFCRFVAGVARDMARGLPRIPRPPALPRPPQPTTKTES
jgi:hypothetical protein